MPAVDVINLRRNEKDSTADFNVALIGQSTLPPVRLFLILACSSQGREPFRHFMETIAGLPEDYSGKLNFLISDGCAEVAARFLLAVLVLGAGSDTNVAVDMVIHLLYSVFLPKGYLQIIKNMIGLFGEHLEEGIPWLGDGNGYVRVLLAFRIIPLLQKWEQSTLTMDSAQKEYDRMRNAPHREDFTQRMYSSLRPSHRLAFWEFRRFGLVLPFGALNAHFNAPNVTLFSADSGKWLQTDHTDPLYLYE